MLLAATEQTRLFLTADLRSVDRRPAGSTAKSAPRRSLATQLKQFPPIEDVVAALDRIASRSIPA